MSPVEKVEINRPKNIVCSKCGEAYLTLYRVRDAKGKKISPDEYRCGNCL